MTEDAHPDGGVAGVQRHTADQAAQLHDGRAQLLKAAYFEMLRDQAKVENFFAEEVYKDDAK